MLARATENRCDRPLPATVSSSGSGQGTDMRWWSAVAGFTKRHKILADVAIGIVFGLAVEFIAVPLFFSDTRLLRDLGDGLVDDAIRIHERLTGTVERATPYVFVDIDDETWRDWGYPLVAPRDKLAGLIDRVMASKPLAVLLDVDLAWPDTAGQSVLADVLKRDNASGPPLFMVRGLLSRAPDDPDQWPRLQVTPFTAAVQAPPSVGKGVSTTTRPGFRPASENASNATSSADWPSCAPAFIP